MVPTRLFRVLRLLTICCGISAGVALSAPAGSASSTHAAAESQPNVVFIISDDHGWSDYGFMGHPQVRTPNIDRLASESLLFTRGYVPTSLCRPSLASIMTGLYPHQHGLVGNDPPGNPRDAESRAGMVKVFKRSHTVAAILGKKGYVSLQTGKWWEGECKCGGFTECMTHGDVGRGGRHGDEGLRIGRETMQPAFEFIDRAADKPFFLWYAPMMPHAPHNPPERLLQRYQRANLPVGLSRYYAMVEWFDETVGQLLDYIEKKGLARTTLVVYVADNGWVQLEGQRSLLDSRAKQSPFDAGTRTPIMVRWPGKVKPRRDDRTLVSSIDIAPTVFAACRVRSERRLPGLNLLDRGALARRKAIFGATFVHTLVDIHNPVANLKYRWAIREGWKLIEPYAPNLALPFFGNTLPNGWPDGPALYDIAGDPLEQRDLAAKHPELVRSLQEELIRWWRTSPP